MNRSTSIRGPIPQPPSTLPSSRSNAELTFVETNQIRSVWTHSGKEYITDVYSLRAVLGELGLYPADDEMSEVLATFDNKVSFNQFLRYVTYLKGRHSQSASSGRDIDTVRAFVALGGDDSRRGDINLDNLRDACKKFQLTIDVDRMVEAADVDSTKGSVDYSQFKLMWEQRNESKTPQKAANSPKQAKSPTARRRHDSTTADDDIEHMLTTGLDDYEDEGSEMPSAPADTPRSVLKNLNVADIEDPSAAGEQHGLTPDRAAALRAYLLGVEARKQPAENELPKRRASLKRNTSRRFTTFPTIRPGGVLANAAEAEKNNSDQDDDADIPVQPEKAGGYRAPSPIILSQYTATRNRPEGNKFGLVSPRGTANNNGTYRSSSTVKSPPKSLKASSSPRKL